MDNPSKIEEFVLNKKSTTFIKKLNKNLKGAEAIIGGSVAKGTWLKGEHDVDVFVLFYKDGRLSDIFLKSYIKTSPFILFFLKNIFTMFKSSSLISAAW